MNPLLAEIGSKAKTASIELAKLSTQTKNEALLNMASSLEGNTEKILFANRKDVEAAKQRGLRTALLDRLALDERKITAMKKCLGEVAELPDPIGTIVNTTQRPNGLFIGQLRVPLGVV
ncbi:MAG: gamma-glutamyl-phosphate reductase, partial [Nitrososphaerales archaeon]